MTDAILDDEWFLSWQLQHFRRVVLRDYANRIVRVVNAVVTTCKLRARVGHRENLLSTLHSTLHTLCALHFTVPTVGMYFPLYIPHSRFHTLYTLHFTLHNFHLTLHTLHFAVRTLQFTLRTPHATLYTPHSTFSTLRFALYTLLLTLHIWHFSLSTVHFTLHTLHFAL